MGFSLSWLAVNKLSEDAIISALGLRKTGKSDEVPDWEISYMEQGAWCFVFLNHDDIESVKPSWVQTLSKSTEVISVFVEEHVMYSRASCWKDGKRVWSVEHDNERGGLADVRSEGLVPASYQAILSELLQRLKEDPEPCDYLFDAPTMLAQDITSYKHDESGENTFWELSSKL